MPQLIIAINIHNTVSSQLLALLCIVFIMVEDIIENKYIQTIVNVRYQITLASSLLKDNNVNHSFAVKSGINTIINGANRS